MLTPSKRTLNRAAGSLQRGRALLLLSALLLAATPAAAKPSPKQEARTLYKKANKLFKRGMYLDALAKYRKARASFVSAAERDEKNARPWFYVAIIDGDHLSKPKDALSDLERYAQLGGKEPTALKWLRELKAIYAK